MIENVGRFAHLPQNVIGGIDRIADRPLVKQLQTGAQFFRAMA